MQRVIQSTNFEFLRSRASDLANRAAIVENLVHLSPSDSVANLRRYAEFLIHAFVLEMGREGITKRDECGRTRVVEFYDLIAECKNPHKSWHIPRQQFQWLMDIKMEGDLATHDRTHQVPNALALLRRAWELTRWICGKLGWGSPAVPFRDPPPGGEELHKTKSDRDEAMSIALLKGVDCSR